MRNQLTLLVGGSLLALGGAADEMASLYGSVVMAPTQYCFADMGNALQGSSLMPQVTMIFSGSTLSTAATAFTQCRPIVTGEAGASAPPVSTKTPSIGDGGVDTQPSVISSSDQVPVPSSGAASDTGALSASDTGALSASGTVPSLDRNTGLFPMSTSDGAPIRSASEVGPGTVDPTAAVSLGVSTTVRPESPVIFPTGQSLANGISQIPAGTANIPESKLSIAPTTQPTTLLSGGLPSPQPTSLNTAAPTGLLASSGLSFGGDPNAQNETLELSHGAVESLRLTLFLKNLGVAVFNSSDWYSNGSSTAQNSDLAPLAALVANISTQETIQQRVIREMLVRSGNGDVPPCRYTLPNNASELSSLMSTIKSAEVGVLLFLSKSLSSEDSNAVDVLSSMGGIAAKQNARLRAQFGHDVDSASFETPISDTWAYNLAQKYVRPGSCAVELPIIGLPMLTANNYPSANVRNNDTVAFAWDAAGRAAASRSGKRLFIGWINQVEFPIYTPLEALADGSGTTTVPPGLSGAAFAVLTAQPGLGSLEELTKATLAGPVVVNLL